MPGVGIPDIRGGGNTIVQLAIVVHIAVFPESTQRVPSKGGAGLLPFDSHKKNPVATLTVDAAPAQLSPLKKSCSVAQIFGKLPLHALFFATVAPAGSHETSALPV